MFAKLATLASLALLAVATPMPTDSEPASSCSTGSIQCCDTVTTAGSTSAASILGLLGVVVQDLNIPVGLTCDPISVIGIGGSGCSANPVCCEDNSYNGLIAIGCVPVNLSL